MEEITWYREMVLHFSANEFGTVVHERNLSHIPRLVCISSGWVAITGDLPSARSLSRLQSLVFLGRLSSQQRIFPKNQIVQVLMVRCTWAILDLLANLESDVRHVAPFVPRPCLVANILEVSLPRGVHPHVYVLFDR